MRPANQPVEQRSAVLHEFLRFVSLFVATTTMMMMMMVVVALPRFSLSTLSSSRLIVVCVCLVCVCVSDMDGRMTVSHNRGHVSRRHVITSRTFIPSTIATTGDQACVLQAPEARSDSVKVQPKRNLRTCIFHVIFRGTSVLGNFVAAVPELLSDSGEEEVENLCSEANISVQKA